MKIKNRSVIWMGHELKLYHEMHKGRPAIGPRSFGVQRSNVFFLVEEIRNSNCIHFAHISISIMYISIYRK